MTAAQSDAWARFHREVPARQHRVAGAWQAVAFGIARQTFVDTVRRHGWHKVAPGIWAERSSGNSYERACWSALVGLRLRGWLSGGSALWMYGAFGQPPAWRPREVDVLLAASHHPRPHPGVRTIRSAGPDARASGRRRGFVVVPALRAWTDYARHASVTQLVVALAGLDRLREATVEDAASYVGERGRFVGLPSARAALDRASGQLTHSTDEHRARRLLDGAALPLAPWPRPFTIRVDGVAIAEVDLPWPQVRYGVEIDGPHHLLPEQQQADRVRDRRLTSLGWVVDRFFVEEVTQAPAEFVRDVRAGLDAAIERGAAAWPT